MSFEDFGKLSKWKARKLVKEKVTENAFKYLTEEKNKQKKISKLEYKRLSIQEYLEDGDKNNEVSKVIFKARSLNLDIKLHKKGNMKINFVLVVEKMKKVVKNC